MIPEQNTADGGPIASSLFNAETCVTPSGGLSIRDFFAGQALSGLCAGPHGRDEGEPLTGNGRALIDHPDILAGLAYGIAEAMLDERKRRTP